MNSLELVDMVNSDGIVTRREVPRDEAEVLNGNGIHIQIAVTVIRNSAGDVLAHQRASVKTREPDKVDHVCGAVSSGETPEETAKREAKEEVGVVPEELEVVSRGVNVYGYYSYLFSAKSDEQPNNLNPKEVAWARYIGINSLYESLDSGILVFVDDFFDDLEAVTARSEV